MYKNANRYMQFSAGRMSLDALIESGIDELSPEQQRENLTARNEYLKSIINSRPKKEKMLIGQEIYQIQQKFIELKEKKKQISNQSVEQHFIVVCKERFTKFQFDLLINEAKKRAAAEGDNDD
jgi:pyruvate formate-lyase activating enzyme-like uncharacterized protein